MSLTLDYKKIIDSDKTIFETLVATAQGVVMIDFGAPWCPPCRTLIPILQELLDTFEGQLIVGSVNVDHHPEIAQRFDIKTLPTVVLFIDGKVIRTFYGKQHFHIYSGAVLEALKGK